MRFGERSTSNVIFDAHLDLAMNAIEWNRDLTQSIAELRQREQTMKDKPDRGRGTVCLPEMRRGGIGLCVATQLARIELPSRSLTADATLRVRDPCSAGSGADMAIDSTAVLEDWS